MVGDTSRNFRSERYYKIPLCKRDCESWFDACKYDYTCRDNWKKGFNWQTGIILKKFFHSVLVELMLCKFLKK